MFSTCVALVMAVGTARGNLVCLPVFVITYWHPCVALGGGPIMLRDTNSSGAHEGNSWKSQICLH